MHEGCKGTYDFIAQWVVPDFFYSKNDVWHRFGMLGVFGDFVLSTTPGDILEIGTGESSIYLSHLAKKYDRTIYHCDIQASKIINPLTVPGYMDAPKSVYCMEPSDTMFATRNVTPLALSFIDGDHIYEQAKKDFENIARLTVDNGYILLHDVYPLVDTDIAENWCGTVYKLRQDIEHDDRFDSITLVGNIAMGVGLMICRKKPVNLQEYQK